MNRIARVLTYALAIPTAAAAQSTAHGDIVGTWFAAEYPEPLSDDTISIRHDYILTLRADNTWSTRFLKNGQEWVIETGPDKGKPVGWLQTVYAKNGELHGRWKMAADTLWFLTNGPIPQCKDPKTAQTFECIPEYQRYQVTRRGQQLALGRFADTYTSHSWADPCPRLFTQVDSAKGLPPVAAPTVTIQRGDLVGAWVSRKAWHGGVTDTLVLRQDSTWTHTYSGAPDSANFDGQWKRKGAIGGTWSLLSGDRLRLRDGFGSSEIELQKSQLFLYNGRRCAEAKEFQTTRSVGAWAYERVNP